jgi:hypothetical protein
VRHECDTEQILVALVYQERVFGECMYYVTLKNRVKAFALEGGRIYALE